MIEEQLIADNTDYMLGMYDLYHNDEEIIEALKAKGLTHEQVQKVLDRIKAPSYLKRISQAKRNIIIGATLFFFLFVVPYILIKWNGYSFAQARAAVENDKTNSGFFKSMVGLYFQLYIFFVIAFLVQMLTGFTNLFKYKKLLKTLT